MLLINPKEIQILYKHFQEKKLSLSKKLADLISQYDIHLAINIYTDLKDHQKVNRLFF